MEGCKRNQGAFPWVARTEELELVVALLLDFRRVAVKLDRHQPLVHARQMCVERAMYTSDEDSG